jgi:hypothetical protein
MSTPYVLVEETGAAPVVIGGKHGSKIRGGLSIFTLVLCLFLFINCILALVAIHTYPYNYRRLHYATDEGVKYNVYNACFTVSVLCVFLM